MTAPVPRDVLVATGNPDADAYLNIARTVLPMQRALDAATTAIEEGRPDQAIPYGDPYPTYQDAATIAAHAHDDMDAAWEKAHARYLTAKATDPAAADAADNDVAAMFEEYFTRQRRQSKGGRR